MAKWWYACRVITISSYLDSTPADPNGFAEPSLIEVSERLAATHSLGEVVEVLRQTARTAIGAEGITVVIREGDQCFYAAEDAISPLWAGQTFNAESCVSGWAMLHRQTAIIPDVHADPRVPVEAYHSTFVQSMAMAPIGRPEPVAALGAYWAGAGPLQPGAVHRLESLARLAAIAIKNARLLAQAEENAQQRSLMIEAGRMGMWTFDVASGVLNTSTMCRENFGRDPQQAFTYADLHAAIHPDDSTRVAEAIAASLATGCDYDIEYRLVTPGGEVRWIGIRARPSFNADGSPLALNGLSIDITDRKRIEEALQNSASTLEHLVQERTQELIATQDALRQAQKLEAMGQLTGGVAHDFNNLLTPILGSLDLLQRRGIGGEREQRLIDGALQSAERARILVQRLLAFARRQPLKSEPIDASALVLSMRDLISTTLGPQVSVRLDLGEALPLAHGDRNQMEMALLNLSMNSRDAMANGGVLTLSTRMVENAGKHMSVPLGRFVIVAVTDTGSGMDGETLKRAIEPFYSTKGVGQGTGLGLSMAHGLVAQLGGALTIESSVGQGTTISLWLPVSDELVLRPIKFAPDLETFSGSVLLVDDEQLVRASTADILNEMGFNVIEARSGEEALALLEAGKNVDALITDHLMPGMTGVDLAHSVQARWPSLPILVISGYSDAIGLSANLPRLEKPFRKADLAAKLAGLLGKPLVDHYNDQMLS